MLLNVTTIDGVNWYCLDGCHCPAAEYDIPEVDTLHILIGMPAGDNPVALMGYLPGVLQGTARVLVFLDKEPEPQLDDQPFWLTIVRAVAPEYLTNNGITTVQPGYKNSDLFGLSLADRLRRMDSEMYQYITVTSHWALQFGLTVPNTTEPIPMQIIDAIIVDDDDSDEVHEAVII